MERTRYLIHRQTKGNEKVVLVTISKETQDRIFDLWSKERPNSVYTKSQETFTINNL